MTILAECAQHCTLWSDYAGLLHDGAHWLFELTGEIVTAPIAVLVTRWWGRREHRRIDVEHGVAHPAKAGRRPTESSNLT